MNNNLFVSTACLDPIKSITSRISKYTNLGINSIELGMKVFVDGDSIKEINLFGLNLTIHNYFPPPKQQFVLNLSSPDEDTRQKSVAHVIQSIELAKTLNAKIYSVHAGFVNDPDLLMLMDFFFPLFIRTENTRKHCRGIFFQSPPYCPSLKNMACSC